MSNLNKMQMDLEIEIYKYGNEFHLWIGHESGSGCEYKIESLEDAGKCFTEYLENYGGQDDD